MRLAYLHRIILVALMAPLLAGFSVIASPVSAQPRSEVSHPTGAAVFYSQLEAESQFSELFTYLHPDAQAIIPEAAVVGWYQDNFAPLGPGIITVTGVEFTSWTWDVTGVTYPETAEVSFRQPFANGSVADEVVRLVNSSGEWRWFFGRSREFVDNQIAEYGSDAVAPGSTSGTCDGAAEWWKQTFPNILAADYLSNSMSAVLAGSGVDPALLQDYVTSFARLHDHQATLDPPSNAARIQLDFLDILRLSELLVDNVASISSGMNPMAERGALSAVVQGSDRIGNLWLNLPSDIDTFLAACEPLVVFVYGMGEDLPVGVLPGEVAAGVPVVDCELVRSQVDAQEYFDAAGVDDPHQLDSDGDNVACEQDE